MRALAVLLLTLLALVPSAQAGLAPGANVVYANYNADAGYYASLEAIESGATGQVLIAPEWGYQSRTMVLDAGFDAPIELDVGAGIAAVAWYDWEAFVSGTVPVVLGGSLDVTMELRQGDTVIATGTQEGVILAPPDEVQVRMTLEILVPQLDPAAGSLEWFVEEAGVASGALFIPQSETGDWSRLELPITGGGEAVATPIHQTLDVPSVSHHLENTTQLYLLNFTSELGASVAQFVSEASRGSVAVTLADGEGAVVFEATLEGADTLDHAIEDAAAGTWTLSLDYVGFTGTFSFALEPAPEAEAEPVPEPASTATATEAPTNATQPAHDAAPAEEAPVPMWVPLALVAAAAVLRRR